MSSITCDACVMQRFTENLITGLDQEAAVLVQTILDHHSFAMDGGEKMQHQWLETCGRELFGEYLFQWIREGKVVLFNAKLHDQHKKHLMLKCGFPFQERHEGIYVAVASEAFPHFLVAEDIDFWEPKEKGCPKKRRDEIMADGLGRVFKYLKRRLEIQVVNVSQALPLLGASG